MEAFDFWMTAANAGIIELPWEEEGAKQPSSYLLEEYEVLTTSQKEAFYEEIERAAWTYLSDRLSIPTAQLNKENIAQILRDKAVNDELINEVHQVLTTAEFARYAPTTDHAMQDMYDTTTRLINALEDQKL